MLVSLRAVHSCVRVLRSDHYAHRTLYTLFQLHHAQASFNVHML
jgi:hypothetical protein